MRIALTGNPNSGKTTMYNALTGRNERVGNWAGVTVERKESPIRKGYFDGNEELIVVDLPGAYSMSPFTSEESITSSYIKNENPDVIINIVDATNLSRSLFFTTQLLELGIPVVVALNKSDITKKKKIEIDVKKLAQKLGCPVIQTISTSSGHSGLKDAIDQAASLKGCGQKPPYIQADIDMQDKAAVEAADRKRYEFVNGIVKVVEKRTVYVKDKNKQDKLDPIFKRVGLSGKSVIPMVIGTGCAIPGIMACRTIRNERERRATAMLTPFMPCGAKLPVIALFAGAFFADAPWVGPAMYLAGIVLIFLGALLVKKTTGYKFRKSFFIIELPEYKFPSLKRAALSMLSRGKAYIVKAGTIILVCNTVVQIMQGFDWQLQTVEEGMESTSILASIASPFAVLLIPLGFGVWRRLQVLLQRKMWLVRWPLCMG